MEKKFRKIANKPILIFCIGFLLVVFFKLGEQNGINEYAKNVENTIQKENKLIKLLKEKMALNWDNIDFWLRYFNVKEVEIVKKQIKLETGNLKSDLCLYNHNLFGFKMPKRRRTTAIYEDGNGYAGYCNYIDCIKDYKIFQNVFYEGNNDYYTFLKYCGYAEDTNYINKLKKMK